jgi:2-C-methyl-D-erythritol 2,4-cyclodiphosphate synthase
MVEGYRVGVGYDIHRLAEGRRLVLGGVEVDYSKGLIGHTDGDAVLHAVTDALLGAAGLPDIGDLFPDTDPTYKDADSRTLLLEVMKKVRSQGYTACNVDVIVHAEAPRLSPYKQRMAESIAHAIGVPSRQVSVKAKTNEGLGPLGHADAIACTAVALVAPTVGL